MKIETPTNDIYVRVKSIASASIRTGTNYDTKKLEYTVEISATTGMFAPIYTTSEMNIARQVLEKIGNRLEAEPSDKTYLDGFKEGTEYALQLIESSK